MAAPISGRSPVVTGSLEFSGPVASGDNNPVAGSKLPRVASGAVGFIPGYSRKRRASYFFSSLASHVLGRENE
jgi:hypothetical protein